jgi:hypothetical protein
MTNHATSTRVPSSRPPGEPVYNRPMSRFYALDEANALLPDLVTVIERLRDERSELVTLRDAYAARERDDAADPEIRRLRLRMRGIVDRMQADAAWLDEHAIVLRDIATGLLDVPALVAGRPIWLCWRSGEPEVGWWHRQDEGFAGRRPIAELGSWEPAPRAN